MLGAGSAAFMEQYGVKYPLYTGAMAKGIAAGGLPLHVVTAALDKIQAVLPNGPYAVNLIHSPFDEGLEKGNVDIFLARGVRIIEASAFMKITSDLVRYRVAGIERCPKTGKAICRNKVIWKVSRTELASMALNAPPADMGGKLLA